MCPGFYFVIVTDSNGCVDSLNLFINSPDSIAIETVNIIDAHNGISDGAIEIQAMGGTPPYMYSLDGIIFQSSGIFSNIAAGAYCVTIRDAKGCEFISCYEVQNITGVSDLGHTLRIFPNPVHSVVRIESDIPVSIEMTDVLGQMIRSDPASLVHDIALTGTPPGVYLLLVSDGENTVCKKLLVQ